MYDSSDDYLKFFIESVEGFATEGIPEYFVFDDRMFKSISSCKNKI